ncbi:MAG TPA: hypothetical protein VFS50_17945 [Meiothermus sp.]|jgi:hypothetical protein|nr:hypothetical protein [Meiothermus sp.]
MFAELYPWIKLVHVVSALVFFGLGGAYTLHKAAVDRAADFDTLRIALARFQELLVSYRLAGLTIFLSGMTLVLTAWGWRTAWVDLALGLFLFNLVIGSFIDEPWGKAMKKLVGEGDGPLTPRARALVADQRMNFSHTIKTGVDFALVFLMTVKPGLGLAVGGAALIITTYTLWATRRKAARPAPRSSLA